MNPTTPPSGPALRDIHPPAPPSWWPPAPGWWILAALVLALIVVASIYLQRRHRRRRRRSAMLAEFESAVAATRSDPPLLASTLSSFLRRAQIASVPASAALSGAAWLDHLDRSSGGDEFSAGVGRVLLDAPYRPHAEFDAPALIALTRRSLLASLDEKVASDV
jgi:hypothetical protein